MPEAAIKDINQTQQERLFHIDFKLRFLGTVSRSDLVSRFGIKAAAATRDISLYKKLAPNNLVYDTKAKTYTQTAQFKPLFAYPGDQALLALCFGLGDDHVSKKTPLITAASPTKLNAPSLDTLAKITQAIHHRQAIKIHYRSLSSGLSQREIVPFALVDNGLRWHVRGFDRKRKQFTDFVVNRIDKPKLLKCDIESCESKEADNQWNRIVELHIVPHPSLKHPETIAAEYAMQNGMLKVNVRAAVAGYVLRHWNIDCSKQHTLTGPANHLWLQNRQTLYGVENLVIAPGYQDEAITDEMKH